MTDKERFTLRAAGVKGRPLIEMSSKNWYWKRLRMNRGVILDWKWQVCTIVHFCSSSHCWIANVRKIFLARVKGKRQEHVHGKGRSRNGPVLQNQKEQGRGHPTARGKKCVFAGNWGAFQTQGWNCSGNKKVKNALFAILKKIKCNRCTNKYHQVSHNDSAQQELKGFHSIFIQIFHFFHPINLAWSILETFWTISGGHHAPLGI